MKLIIVLTLILSHLLSLITGATLMAWVLCRSLEFVEETDGQIV